MKQSRHATAACRARTSGDHEPDRYACSSHGLRQTRRPIAIAASSLLVVLVAYLPTLQFDYAVRDQWRAFRAPESSTRLDELVACSRDALPFYVRSGRPLVWVGEWTERALVSNIREFWYLRLISLTVILATLLYLAVCLSRVVGLETALFAASLFVLLPGFVFMTELGLNGAPVVLAVTAAVASFSQISRSVFATRTGRGVVCRRSVTALVLFVIACFLYRRGHLSSYLWHLSRAV